MSSTLFALLTCLASAYALSITSIDSTTLLNNGRQAQNRNLEFLNIQHGDCCTVVGEQACVQGKFSICDSGNSWAESSCPASLICAALPLTTEPGISVACTTEADAISRITATGADGGLLGPQANSTTTPVPPTETQTVQPTTLVVPPSSPSATPTTQSSTSTSTGTPPIPSSMLLQNGLKAQAETTRLDAVSARDRCDDPPNVPTCVEQQLATCQSGSWVLQFCTDVNTRCFIMPLLDAPGIHAACATKQQAQQAFQATGVLAISGGTWRYSTTVFLPLVIPTVVFFSTLL